MSASNRTTQAVRRQLKAMNATAYDIGIRDARKGKMMNEVRRPGEVLRQVPRLRALNTRGNDIYIRPHGESDIVLVDDVDSDTIEAMRSNGHEAALVVETSPRNFQAWVRVGAASHAVRGHIARYLAQRYGADRASADANHYGRLSGFTNRKPEHRAAAGLYPWVLCRRSGGERASAADDLLVLGEAKTEAEEAAKVCPAVMQEAKNGTGATLALKAFARAWNEADGEDASARDWAAVCRLARAGYSQCQAVAALLQSPDLGARKRGHVEDYVRRTVEKAYPRRP